jgi:excisionase family DNA binding protein
MNKQEAADYLNISVRTLQRLTADGAIIAGMVKGKTGLVTDYTKDDLDAYKKRAAEPQQRDDTRYVKPHVIPSDTPSHALQRAANVEGMQAFASMVADALAGAQTRGNGHADAVPLADLSHKMTLSFPEAARLSGVPESHLRSAYAEGKLRGAKIGRGVRVSPDALKAYVEQRMKAGV